MPPCVALGETDPHALAEQEAVQMTPLALTSFTRLAVNGSEVVSNTVALLVLSETLIGGGGGVDDPPQPTLTDARAAANNTPTTATRLLGDIYASISIFGFSGDASRIRAPTPQGGPTTEPLYTPPASLKSSPVSTPADGKGNSETNDRRTSISFRRHREYKAAERV